jgi:hypothetical protein
VAVLLVLVVVVVVVVVVAIAIGVAAIVMVLALEGHGDADFQVEQLLNDLRQLGRVDAQRRDELSNVRGRLLAVNKLSGRRCGGRRSGRRRRGCTACIYCLRQLPCPWSGAAIDAVSTSHVTTREREQSGAWSAVI